MLNRKTAGSLGLTLALACSAGACSTNDIVKGAVNSATGGKVNIDADKGQVSVKGDNGETMNLSGSNKLPDGFPSNIPIPPGAKVAGSMTASDNKSGKGGGATLVTNRSVDEVVAFYKEQLPAKGWTIQANFSSNKGANLTAKQGNQTMNATIAEGSGGSEQGKTGIVLAYGTSSSSDGSSDGSSGGSSGGSMGDSGNS